MAGPQGKRLLESPGSSVEKEINIEIMNLVLYDRYGHAKENKNLGVMKFTLLVENFFACHDYYFVCQMSRSREDFSKEKNQFYGFSP